MAKMVSAVVITQNEEKSIGKCLKCLRWADEIIVVDGYSSDKTARIAKENGAKVFLRRFDGYYRQKNFAIGKAKCDWVLSVDADEIITPELKREMLVTIHSGTALNGFSIPRKNYYYGGWLRFGGVYPDRQLRLFKNGTGQFDSAEVHEGMRVAGLTGELKNPLEHFTRDTIKEHIEYVNTYTDLEAKALAAKGYEPTGYSVIIKPFFYFFKHYIGKAGFLDGVNGLVYHTISAMYVFIREVKAAELSGISRVRLLSTLFKRARVKKTKV